MSQNSIAVDDKFVAPNEENIKNLAPGCFVRVQYQSQNMWVEITDVDDEQFQGVLQPEPCDGGALQVANTVVHLQTEQINALGCDRYCYCD